VTTGTVSLPLHSKRRARADALQHLQHAIPAFGLAITGLQALAAGAHGFELVLAIAEVVTSTVLVAAAARHLRHPHSALGHQRIEWVTLFAAAMLFTEAAEKFHATGRLWTPQTLTALATVVVAFTGKRRQRRRMLSISPERLVISRGRFRKKLSAPWEDIASIEIHEREALIYTRDGGRRRLDLSDLENRSDVVAAMRDAQARLHAASS
jgi:hypothetical protein